MTSVRAINSDSPIQSKSEILLEGLTDFFWNNEKINIMLPIINGQSNISLRILDWFVTNYCRKYKTQYNIIDDNGNLEKFYVHIEYKGQLKAFNKKLFDPFCRRTRIQFKYNENNMIETTIGQLNFFKWAIKNDVIKYVEHNIKDIDKDMTQSKKDKQMKKQVKINNKVKDILNNQVYKKIIDIPDNIKQKLIDLDDSPDENIKSNNDKLVISAIKTVKKNKNKIVLVFE